MITEADGEYEADDYWPDKANQDTGFKCLFEDNTYAPHLLAVYYVITAHGIRPSNSVAVLQI